MDISTTPHYIIRKLNVKNILDKQEYLEKYLVRWPLNFVCSIKVKNEHDKFKPEYIISQLLLQTMYFRQIFQEDIGKYDKRLLNKFKITGVLTGKELLVLSKTKYVPKPDIQNRKIVINNKEVLYYSTIFGYVDKRLMGVKSKYIDWNLIE